MWRRLLRGLLRSRSRGAGAAAPTPSRTGPGAGTTPRRDWARLAPLRTGLQRSWPEVSGMGTFSSGLATRHRGVRHVQPLGHEVVPHTPHRGIVTGIARSVAGEPTHPPVVELPLADPAARRRARRTARTGLRWPTGPAEPSDPRAVPELAAAEVAPHATLPDTGGEQVPESPPVAPPAAPPGPPTDRRPATAPPTPPGPDGPAPAAVPPESAAPAGRSTTRPLVHEAPRVLRSVPPHRPTTPPRTVPPRPAGLPVRPLGVPPVEGEARRAPSGPAAARQAPVAPPPDEPAAAPPPPEAPADVRPTIGAPDERPGTASVREGPATPGTSRRGATPAPDQPGVGSPLESLPPTARPVHRGHGAHPSVTAHGQQAAIAEGLERLGRVAGPARHRPDVPASTAGAAQAPPDLPPARPRPDLTMPPVVARRVERPLVEGRATAPSHPVLPLAGLREPLIAPAPGRPDHRDAEAQAGPPPAVPVRWAGSAAPPGPTSTSPRPPAATPPPRVPVLRATASHRRSTPAGPGDVVDRPGGVADEGAPTADAPLGDLPAAFSDHPLVERLRVSRSARSAPDRSAGPTPAAPLQSTPARRLPLVSPVQRHEPREPALVDGAPTASSAPPGPVPSPVQRVDDAPEPVAEATTTTTEAEAPDVDELFDELYPRVRDELRWELRVQRERAGLLSDPL